MSQFPLIFPAPPLGLTVYDRSTLRGSRRQIVVCIALQGRYREPRALLLEGLEVGADMERQEASQQKPEVTPQGPDVLQRGPRVAPGAWMQVRPPRLEA